ncbi:MAG: DUF4160 domain-containing protein [Pyrinomonadaceae bacterium]
MPVISSFYGILILMYYFDNRRHHVPHVHVKHGDENVVLSIPEGEVLEGSIRPNKLKLAQAWIEIHQTELMEDWELAISGRNVFRIEPLR